MPHPLNFRPTTLPVAFLLTLGLSSGWATAKAASPDSAPPELKNTLAQIDAAANSRNVQAVMQFYGANFSNSDGLNRESMEKTLTQLWQRYPQLKYRTELKSWQNQGNGIVAETVTNITGTQPVDGRTWSFNATISSKQRLENQKIVNQEILSEKTQLTSGEKPPTVNFKLPEQVRTGQEFNFDVVVKEPLKDNLLVGTALLEEINPNNYLNSPKIQLEPLNAGGIFKVGRAPNDPGKYWISAVLVRSDGITIVSQRLPVIAGGRNNPKPTRSNSPAPARPSRPGRTSG
ncbi:nuclear transport factor 2 family protein [Floridanema aerugineum]|jgi:autonomous glycyl radical cofactor GrcA|uniref:Nuclear transport factor 2 family protein n=1 Tax=Floridaenema aerugineum BLCC-F46 TaxID=3153654 RepID=A0ABV4XD72_9CYAN